MKLNIGCGVSQMEGYVNLDKNVHGQEVLRDVLNGLPFDDNKFDEVYTSHFMEHIPAGVELYFVLSEIWRVCKDGATFIIRVPHSDTHEAFFPDHLSWWNEAMVRAVIADPYQRDSNYFYNFELVSMERSGIELHVILKAKIG